VYNLQTWHFRRKNKIVADAAVFHNIEEYMEEVELWFNKYEMSHPATRRRIYLASDEPQVMMIKCQDFTNV
jgi:hypothetical protein